MTKVQLSLTPEETKILTKYGNKFGYNLPRTIRYVITKAAEDFLRDGEIPVYKASSKREAAGLKALKEYKEGKTVEIKNVEEFFDNL